MSTKPEIRTVLKRGFRKAPYSYSERREPFAVIRCPGCQKAISVDLNQYEGKTSIQCTGCNYHETHNLTGASKCLKR